MRLFYQLIVLYLTVHLLWLLFRQKRFWSQVSIGIVLTLFLLRLFMIK
jgi:hypothetical protein